MYIWGMEQIMAKQFKEWRAMQRLRTGGKRQQAAAEPQQTGKEAGAALHTSVK